MPVKINANGTNETSSLLRLSQTEGQTSKSLKSIASGSRINGAADDAAGLTISTNLRSLIKGLETASRNSQDAISLTQIADGGLDQTATALQRVRELTVQASNGTLDQSARNAIGAEVSQALTEIDRVAHSTTFGSQKLLDGSVTGGFNFNVGSSGDPSNSVNITIANSSSTGLGIAGTPGTIASGGDLSSVLSSIDNAITSIANTRTELGSHQNRLETTLSNTSNSIVNLASSFSRISDTDSASAISEFSAGQIQNQFALALQAQANSLNRSSISNLLR